MTSSGTRVLKALAALSVFAYALAVVGVWALMFFTGDRWWFGTVLLYGPRWIYFFPLFVLVPLALLWNRRGLWLLGLTALVIAWPMMGFNLPKSFPVSSEPADLRVLTYNIERWEVTADEFARLLDEVGADLAAVQEIAPRRFDLPPQWHVKRAGESLLVSRYPIAHCDISKREPQVNGIYCVLETPKGPLGFACVDILTPRRALDKVLDRERIFDFDRIETVQAKIEERWYESSGLYAWIASFPEENKIIAGDFNLTVDSPIYRRIWSSHANAFNRAGFGYGFTKFTKINRFRYSARIDHILSTPDVKPVRAWVGPDLGSDHYPLIAEFRLVDSVASTGGGTP
ncbi:endonuclease/exonuclease/phosphatase family protein [Geoalkalibacter sp.]|uniref:endonuclease/exonuclease/phosphatase family protein n=1 Tax=Geoalkalibacter sp. TaxID=3041440 RepID=UPI00272EB3C5|nr:endonuclease/exonuclease/phosphatase family protein [Geoalkalibacter sp.]